MSVFHWLGRFPAQRCRSRSTDRAPAAQRRRSALSVTLLEDRLAPALLTVNSLGDGPVSAASSSLSLREAVALIDSGGTATDSSGHSLAAAKAAQINTATPFGSDDDIDFAPNLVSSVPGQVVLEGGSLLLDRDATISGPAATQLAISGNDQTRVFEITAGSAVVISGLTVEAGAAGDEGGGGILNAGTLTLIDTTVTANSAIGGNGGGIANNGSLVLVGSEVSGNIALNDAGIINTATLTLNESTVSGNNAVGSNGGLANYGGTMTIANSTISGNGAFGAGGVGNYDGGTATLLNSTVSGNSAIFTGGIFNTATLTLTDSTVSTNAAQSNGGGIANVAMLTVVESTITGNTAATGNGGTVNFGSLDLRSSNITGNSDGPVSSSPSNSGSALAPVPTNDAGSGKSAESPTADRTFFADATRAGEGDGGPGAQGQVRRASVVTSADENTPRDANPVNDPAIFPESASVRNDASAATPADRTVPGTPVPESMDSRTAIEQTKSSAETKSQTAVEAAANSARRFVDGAASQAREETGSANGSDRETMWHRLPANDEMDAATPHSAERFIALEQLLNSETSLQAEWAMGDVAGLLLPWLLNAGRFLESSKVDGHEPSDGEDDRLDLSNRQPRDTVS